MIRAGTGSLEPALEWRDAFADPHLAALPVSREMFAFIDAAWKAADAH